MVQVNRMFDLIIFSKESSLLLVLFAVIQIQHILQVPCCTDRISADYPEIETTLLLLVSLFVQEKKHLLIEIASTLMFVLSPLSYLTLSAQMFHIKDFQHHISGIKGASADWLV